MKPMYKLDQTLRGIQLLDPIKLEWMEDLMYQLEERGDMDRSDAQGFHMCRQDITDELYEEGYTPENAADYLLNKEE